MNSIPRCLEIFEESIKSQVTKKNYKYSLDRFLNWSHKDYESFLALPENELQTLLEDYVIYLKRRVNPNSVPKLLQGVQKFLKTNHKKYDRETIEGLFPEEVESGGERTITTKEIQIMLEFTSSKRAKALIHLLASTKRKELIKKILHGGLNKTLDDSTPNILQLNDNDKPAFRWKNMSEIEEEMERRANECRDCGSPYENEPFECGKYQGDNEPILCLNV